MPSKTYLDEVIKRANKVLGKDGPIVGFLSGGAKSEITCVVPTGISVLDHYIIGIGGLPAGRLAELFGGEGVGKTSLAWQLLAACQADGGVAALVENEGAISEARAKVFGVNIEDLVLSEPDTMEDSLNAQEALLKAMPVDGSPNLLVWDSLAATPTKRELLDGLIGDAAIAERARVLSQACRSLPSLMRQANTAVVWVNQVRDQPGVIFGNRETTPGGRAVKFLASLRICIMGGKATKSADEHTGKDVTIMALKNKLDTPFRKARVRLSYAEGWDDDWSTFQFAKLAGYIGKGTQLSEESVAAAKAAIAANGWVGSEEDEDA